MNFKRKLLCFLISFIYIIPINVLAYSKYLIPSGETIGIKVECDGVMVVGFYKVDGVDISRKAGFKLGDRIISINDIRIHNVEELINSFNRYEDSINITYSIIRNNEPKEIEMTLNKSKDSSYKTGIYVKDSIIGIGTLTFINPENNTFGALGHEITDTNTNKVFDINKGNIFSSKITSISKGSVTSPGEKNAKINMKDVYGNITLNSETGIFGKLTKDITDNTVIEVADIDEVKIGKAEIITVLNDNKKEKFNIEILSIDKSNTTKNFVIKITDNRLLNKTGGIIRGMSGSPIIQDNKLIGAITHTIVDNPKKGYGISIIKMLESME